MSDVLFNFTKAKVLGLVCLTTMALLFPLQAQNRSPDIKQFEGNLSFHQDLPVGLVSGTAEHPQLISVKSIRFETIAGNCWGVTARVGWLLVKDFTWQLTIELLDEKGRVLRHPLDNPVVFTCKAGESGKKKLIYADLVMDWMHFQGRHHAKRFRLRLEPSEQITAFQKVGPETHTLEVRIVDQKSRLSINDAVVVVTKSYYQQGTYRQYKTLYPTDSYGQCNIKLPENMLHLININVQKEGYCTIQKSWSNSGSWPIYRGVLTRLPQNHLLEMIPAGSVGGIVKNTEGNPVENVVVHFTAYTEEPSGMISINRTIQTDAKGRWSVDGVPPDLDSLSVGLRHPEYGSDNGRDRYIRGDAILKVREQKHVEIIKKGLTITGRIINDQEVPVTNATVMVISRSFNPLPAFTNESGIFKLNCAPDMSAYSTIPVLVVEAPGYATLWKKLDFNSQPEPLELRLIRGRNVTCRVLDTEGKPIAGAWIVLDLILENSPYGIWLDNTDEHGEFQVSNVPKNDVKLTIGKQGYIAVRDFVVSPSESQISLTMNRALQVQGSALDAQNGEPIPNFEIAAVFESDGRVHTSKPMAFIEGTYELNFDESRPESFQLKVSAIGYEPSTSEEIRINEGRRTIDFKLARSRSFDKTSAGHRREEIIPTGPRRITGIVRDERDRPVPDAVISTRPWWAEDTITNTEGVFKLRLRRKPVGTMGSMSTRQDTTYLLIRQKKRNLAAAIELEDNTETLDIKLSPGVILSGKVVDVEGKGIANAEISLTFWISDSGYPSRETVQIDSQGNYEIRAVPSDHRYSVNASAEGYGQQYVRVNTSEAADARMELEPLILMVANLSVSGIVVDEDDKPVANAEVNASGRGQPDRWNRSTDKQGRFKIDGVCEGGIRLWANVNRKERLYGNVETEGGATGVEIVVGRRGSARRPVPKRPPSLVGKHLPDLQVLKVDLSTDIIRNEPMLVCFFDMQQRPSRYSITQLAKQAEHLKQQGIIVVAVQASKMNEHELSEWLKKYNIPFPVGMIQSDEEKIRFSWGVRSLPWLILSDKKHIVQVEDFALSELSEKLKQISDE